jgi:hypothetical protein
VEDGERRYDKMGNSRRNERKEGIEKENMIRPHCRKLLMEIGGIRIGLNQRKMHLCSQKVHYIIGLGCWDEVEKCLGQVWAD